MRRPFGTARARGLLAWKRDRSPPTVSPSWDAPARAIYNYVAAENVFSKCSSGCCMHVRWYV